MSNSSSTDVSGGARPAAELIRAFLASMRPMGDVADHDGYWRGAALVERLAATSNEEEPSTLRLSAAECADILSYLGFSQPLEARDWWPSPMTTPSHFLGYCLVLAALEESMWAIADEQPESDAG